MTARTQAEVQADMQADLLIVDPSADVYNGPILDWVITPVSTEVSAIEVKQDRTDRIASADFAAVANEEELTRMAGVVGAGPADGMAAVGVVFIGRRSAPQSGRIYPIAKGSVVGTSARTFLFLTTEDAEIDGNFPDVYFNPTKNTYEVPVNVQAVAVGSAYNLPPTRVNTIVTNIEGIDYAENRDRMRDGLNAGDTSDLQVRGETHLAGQREATPAGTEAAIVDAVQDVGTIAVIASSSALFRRTTTTPGADYYYSGESSTEDSFEYSAVGGELSVLFEKNPVLSVISVIVNGISASYEFIQDADVATRGSTNDASYILFENPLSPGDVVSLRYNYDAFAEIVAESFTDEGNGFFSLDSVARRAVRMNPLVTMSVSADTGFSAFTLKDDVLAAVESFFGVDSPVYGASYDPESFKDYIKTNVTGTSDRPNLTVFTMNERSFTDVEIIEFRDNEIPEIDSDLIVITIL